MYGHQYLESTLVPRQCDDDMSLIESRIKASADFFGPSCKAGPWVPDPKEDRILSKNLPNNKKILLYVTHDACLDCRDALQIAVRTVLR